MTKEVLKYALCMEEYIGLLGKEYAKDQQRGLTMDLTKLKNDAASVTNPPLVWSKVVERIRYSLKWFLSANL